VSEDQINALARAVARELREQQPPHPCPFDADDISTLKRFCRRAEAAEKAAIAALIKVTIIGAVAIFLLGLVAWIKKQLGI